MLIHSIICLLAPYLVSLSAVPKHSGLHHHQTTCGSLFAIHVISRPLKFTHSIQCAWNLLLFLVFLLSWLILKSSSRMSSSVKSWTPLPEPILPYTRHTHIRTCMHTQTHTRMHASAHKHAHTGHYSLLHITSYLVLNCYCPYDIVL